jgi:hypothetical protein
MKKSIPLLAFFLFSILFINCGDKEDSCSQEDWLGTYDLVGDAECDFSAMGSIVFNSEIVITGASTSTTITWDGFEENFTDCTASDGIVQLTLNGDTITSRIGECTKEYSRR